MKVSTRSGGALSLLDGAKGRSRRLEERRTDQKAITTIKTRLYAPYETTLALNRWRSIRLIIHDVWLYIARTLPEHD